MGPVSVWGRYISHPCDNVNNVYIPLLTPIPLRGHIH